MKSFLIFYGSYYYPAGGIQDLIGSEDSLEEAIKFLYTYAKK